MRAPTVFHECFGCHDLFNRPALCPRCNRRTLAILMTTKPGARHISPMRSFSVAFVIAALIVIGCAASLNVVLP